MSFPRYPQYKASGGEVPEAERMNTPLTNPSEAAFAEVVSLIHAARQQTFQAVNTSLIDFYWQVGAYISRNLFRMRQFYETYRNDEKVSPLVAQLSWSHNLLILGQSKRPEEREFYLQNLGADEGDA